MVEKLRREVYGQRSERKARLPDQLELELEELEARASEDELAAEQAAAKTSTVKSFTRRRPSRKPFPEHLPRERVVVPAPEVCGCCGSDRLSKLGEDITETLEVIPRSWKVVQTVREKFTCRGLREDLASPRTVPCDPAGLGGSEPAGHDPVREVWPTSAVAPAERALWPRGRGAQRLSTLADQVGACTTVLRPLHDLIAAHVLAAERIHGDDTTVPVLAKGKTDTARAWVYVRDDAPSGGADPPAALFYYSRDRSGAHPEKHLTGFTGILQADAYAGYNRLYALGRSPGPVTEALCWAHARRKFFVLADIAASAKRGAKKGKQRVIISPLAFEAVTRIDALFDVEREINRLSAEGRLTVRAERSAPLLAELEAWLRAERARLSRHAPVAKAMDYMLKRWPGFARFLEDGRVCLTNNAAERALRGIALGRKAWLFAGSDRGGHRAAFMYTLIVTAKMNDVDPQAWLADVLARIADHSSQRLDELLPWNWKQAQAADTLAA